MDILSQLKELRLHGMGRSWKTLTDSRKHHELSLTEGLELLLQSETGDRDHKRFSRLKTNAKFRYQASIEELSMDASRGLDKSLITELALGDYITKGESVLVTGATGCGKSFFVSALGHQACSQGYKVLYFNLQKLLLRTKMTRVDGTIYKFMEKISKADLFIMDDFGLTRLKPQQRLDLMEIIEDRHTNIGAVFIQKEVWIWHLRTI